MKSFLILVLPALFCSAPAAAGEVSDTVILVAKRQLRDRFYGATILVARPIGNGEHIGFVGGPVNSESIFALVQTSQPPGGRSVQLMADLYAGSLVGRVIESDPGRARFVAGLVAWRAGELLVLRKQTEGMWEELVHRAEAQSDSGRRRSGFVRRATRRRR